MEKARGALTALSILDLQRRKRMSRRSWAYR